VSPELFDSRRLTGANLFWDLPCAIIDAKYCADASPFIASWTVAAKSLLSAIGYSEEKLCHRVFEGGFSLIISAPIDVLYSMCELNEMAFALALNECGHSSDIDFDECVGQLKAQFAEEQNPPLLALQAAAKAHQVPFLWDDDLVSVAYGKTAKIWTPDKLPAPEDVDWQAVASIPVALVTGTNGKSTTVRMSAAIMAASGKQAGLTSTDWIRIGEHILDTGDYSGTGGARTLMRHPETEVAVLETARGGLLRRGLGVEKVSAAVITNVAADHLGDYGINTVPELIEAKFIVRRALDDNAPLILNADDEGIINFAAGLDCKIIWFSLDPNNPVILNHLVNGGQAAILNNGALELASANRSSKLIDAIDIPATMNGAAKHNVQNALAAMALCSVLGADDRAIHGGLASFMGDESDNPGRGNWFKKDGVQILVDFAHNAHGMEALSTMVSQVPSQRRVLLIGQAGDRLDKEIADMTLAACEMNPDSVLACALPGYERGRPQSQVQELIRQTAIQSGVSPEQIFDFDSPPEAASSALQNARDGDLLVFLALTQREEVFNLIYEFIGQSKSND
jgi:UDP-N-acetylmuramyl tripeptide synthase